MTDGQVALYARVSSEHQAEANTIDSQVAEIRARIAADGIDLRSVLAFIDAGSSGSSLVRPALEGQPFQHGHLCARSLAVETCFPF